MEDLKSIRTEQRNPETMHIDELSTLDMVRLINREDHRVAEAVAHVCPQIAQAVDIIAAHLHGGGRLVYCGCGTSGRLGILDAVECPPTYSTPPEMVVGLIAGGYPAIFKAVEGAEDNRALGREDLAGISFCKNDVLVGIASSGVHSNGFSLVRKILADNCLDLHKVYPELSNKLLGEVLLTPTKIYVKQVLEVIRSCDVHGISHITGGGFDENIPRILHEGQGLEIEEGTWEILPVFRFLEKYGKVAHREMFNIFNMGIGMVIALDASQAEKAIAILAEQGEKAAVIGRVTDTEGVVIR